jgi:hypothetical protein
MQSADKKMIRFSEQYPYGALFCHPRTDSINGYPPLVNPALGAIYIPTSVKSEYEEYPGLVKTLVQAMSRAIPGGMGAHLNIELRTPSNDTLNAAFDLSCTAFVLAEFVDEAHPLVKVATHVTFAEFKAAILAL